MPVNLSNSMWARRMAQQQQQLAQQKAEMQQAHMIAAQGSKDVNRIQQQAFQEGLRAAREAGQAAGMTGKEPPQYENPQLAHAAQMSALTTQGALEAQQRKRGFEMLRDNMRYASAENIAGARLAQQNEASKLANAAKQARLEQDKAFHDQKMDLENSKLALSRQRMKLDKRSTSQSQLAQDTKLLKEFSSMVDKHGKDLLGISSIEQFKRNDPRLYELMAPLEQYLTERGLIDPAGNIVQQPQSPLAGPDFIGPPPPAGPQGNTLLDHLAARNKAALLGR